MTHETRIEHALSLVNSLARLFAHRYPAEREELVSVGHEAVVRADRSYDPLRGVSFDAHAWVRIRYAMLEHVRREAIRRRQERERGLRVELDAAHPHDPELRIAETITRDGPEVVERAFEVRHALGLVAGLPAREREALTRVIRGEENQEIAEALGVSTGRAWQLHAQATQRIRQAA